MGIRTKQVVHQRVVDIEMTTDCNTTCMFCPRHKTPSKGYISFDTLVQTVKRIKELKASPKVTFCALGEPLLHSQLIDFVDYMTAQDLPPTIATNASLLTEKMTANLLSAGIEKICFSVSGLNDTYEKIHRLDFENTKKNILHFLKVSSNQVEVNINIVITEENRNQINEIKSFWKSHGVYQFIVYDYVNRGGALDIPYLFMNNDRFVQEALDILDDHRLPYQCLAPTGYVFVGWDGKYYLCSNDYQKQVSFGTVYEQSIEEVDVEKWNRLTMGIDVCKRCDLDPVNQIREVLYRIEKSETDESDIQNIIDRFKFNFNRT